MNRMQTNYDNMKQIGRSLKESVDCLRASVKDLYELDEDNYHMIKKLRDTVDKMSGRVEAAQKAVHRLRGKTLLSFLGLSGLVYVVCKAGAKLEARVDALENAGKEKVPEKEESDG